MDTILNSTLALVVVRKPQIVDQGSPCQRIGGPDAANLRPASLLFARSIANESTGADEPRGRMGEDDEDTGYRTPSNAGHQS